MDEFFSTDACPSRIGGICQGQYFHEVVPDEIQSDERYTIAHIEFVAVIVAVKLWKHRLSGKRVCIHCDNSTVVDVVSHGKARDILLQDLLREFVFVCETNRIEVVIRHIFGLQNRIPDLLSRHHLDVKYRKQFQILKDKEWERVIVPNGYFYIKNPW